MKNELLLHSNTGCSLRAAIALLLLSGLVTPAFSAQTTPEPGNGAMLLAGFILILVGCAKTARLRSFAGVAAMLLIATSFAKADVIQFEGAPAGINDGQYYVTPYEITINGVDALVTCYDTFDGVNIGDTWDANLLTLGEAAASGFFTSDPNALARYEEVAWLEAQTYQNVAQEIGLQYAIWSVFGTARHPASQAYDAAANAAAATGYQGFSFNNVFFIEEAGGVSGQAGTEQAFVYWDATVPSHSNSFSAAPEPGSWMLLIAAIGFAAVRAARQRTLVFNNVYRSFESAAASMLRRLR